MAARHHGVIDHDLRIAVRQLTRHPGISLAAIATLAIGMALNAVAFGAVNGFFFKGRAGAGVPGAGWILPSGGSGTDDGVSYPEYERLSQAVSGSLLLAVESRTTLARQHDRVSETVWALLVSSHYFDILEAKPHAGQLLGPHDAAGAPAVVVSERYWREKLNAASPGAPTSLMTMTAMLQMPRWPARTASLFFGTCGVLAALLATMGLVAVMWHAVSERTREFGVRLALGATRAQLLRDVLRSGWTIVIPGVVVGLIAAGGLAYVVRSALAGVSAASPTTYLGVAVLQMAVSLAACAGPARRASRVDPVVALRAE